VITNNQIKLVKSLHQRKFRQKYDKFIAEGDKMGQEILQNSIYDIDAIFALASWAEENEESILKHRSKVHSVTKSDMSKISALSTSSGVLMVVNMHEENTPKLDSGHTIFLDGVQDPGNVGTIIRLADWFGFKQVIRNKNTADFYSPKTIQATMGSFLNVDLITAEFGDLDMEGVQSIGADMHGKPLQTMNWSKNTLLVMGSEGRGISGPVHQELDDFVTIPGSASKVAESLNVAMATGIIASYMMGSSS